MPGAAVLRGWDYPASGANAPIVLFFNGNGMTVDRSDPLYRSLAQEGAEVMVYDYRGIGFSAGQPDMLAFREDSLRVYDAVVAAHPGRTVVVYGFSLGTAMASYVASQRAVAGLILAGTIATAEDEFPVYLRAVGFPANAISTMEPGQGAIEAFNEVANVSHSRAPLLMLHGEADALVPIAQGRKVFAACPAPKKQFVALPGVSHNATAGTEASLTAVGRFLGQFRS
jgi:alpha-beta hydrolase superfamily lysophospholipase